MGRSSLGSTQNTSIDESTQEESKSSKLYRTLLISGLIKKPEQLRGSNFNNKERDKFWKKSKDEIERCFGSKLCKLDKSVVILKSEGVKAAISKYRERIGLDEKVSPVEVCLQVLLQCIVFNSNKLPKEDAIEIFTNMGFQDNRLERLLGGKKIDTVLREYVAGHYLEFNPSVTGEKGKKDGSYSWGDRAKMEFDAREMIMNFQSKIDPRGRGREELYKLHCKAVIDQFESFKKAQLEKADMPQPSPQD